MIHYLLLALGFVILVKGADILIDGSSYIAHKLKIPQIVVGLTIIAFGTSAPEFVINLIASIHNSGGIALGNIIGSNVANIFLILGISSLICNLPVKENTFRFEIPFSILSVLILAILANGFWISRSSENIIQELDFKDGIILLSFFVLFLLYTYKISRDRIEEEVNIKDLKVYQAVLYVVLGLIGLSLGGKWIYDATVYIARSLGIDEFIIAVSLVAIGTSLPELAASVVAALKKNTDIAIGNVVGSNIFNILWVLGFSSIVNPINIHDKFDLDLLVVFASSVLLFLFLTFSKEKVLRKWHGILFLFIYVGYMAHILISEIV